MMQLKRETMVWLLLVALTMATYFAGKLGYQGKIMIGLLMLSVFIKGHFIIADFMELQSVQWYWQAAMHGWLVMITGLIFIAYLIGLSTF